jgi:hypothetical protein
MDMQKIHKRNRLLGFFRVRQFSSPVKYQC